VGLEIIEAAGKSVSALATVRRPRLPRKFNDEDVRNEKVLSNRGSLRVKYRFLPRSAWAKLNRLKRQESFADLPGDPGPGGPALLRFVEDSVTGSMALDCIIVTGDGQVLRFAETMEAPPPLPRVA
jgi:hypothetical protein